MGTTPELDLSLALATHNRCRALARTLASLARMDTAGVRWEVVVVDNGSRDATDDVALRFATQLPLRYAHEPRPGKSAALNSTRPALRGRLIAFTDDDILFDPGWLHAVLRHAADHPHFGVLTGPVEPCWSRCPRAEHLQHPFAGEALSLRAGGGVTGELPAGQWPLGCNTIMHQELLDARPFDEARGPIGRTRLIGNDTALMMTLAARGARFLFVPAARVRHLIQPQQMLPRYLWRRAFQRARTIAHGQGIAPARTLAGVPRWLLRRLAHSAARLAAATVGLDRRHRIHAQIEFADALGTLCAARELGRASHRFRKASQSLLPVGRALSPST